MEVEYLRTFLAVLDEEGFAAAGRRLHLSPASVSERVQRLEQEVGAPLVDRRPLALTAAGATLEPAARRIVADVDAVLDAVAGPSRHAAPLTVGVMAGGAVELNAPIRAALERVLPGCRISWWDLPLADTEAAVLDGRVDVAILRSPVQHPGLETLQLFLTHRLVLAARNGPFGSSLGLTVADLGDHAVTGISERHGRAFQEFFRLGPERNGELAPVVEVDTFGQAFRTVVSGRAVAVPSALAVRVFDLPRSVVAVRLGDAAPSGPVAVCRRQDRRSTVRLFMSVVGHVSRTCRHLVPDCLGASV